MAHFSMSHINKAEVEMGVWVSSHSASVEAWRF